MKKKKESLKPKKESKKSFQILPTILVMLAVSLAVNAYLVLTKEKTTTETPANVASSKWYMAQYPKGDHYDYYDSCAVERSGSDTAYVTLGGGYYGQTYSEGSIKWNKGKYWNYDLYQSVVGWRDDRRRDIIWESNPSDAEFCEVYGRGPADANNWAYFSTQKPSSWPW